jgi:hypothetical protein
MVSLEIKSKLARQVLEPGVPCACRVCARLLYVCVHVRVCVCMCEGDGGGRYRDGMMAGRWIECMEEHSVNHESLLGMAMEDQRECGWHERAGVPCKIWSLSFNHPTEVCRPRGF